MLFNQLQINRFKIYHSTRISQNYYETTTETTREIDVRNCFVKPMTVIVPRNVNCNKGLIATQAKPVCIILHSIKEITSDERKTLTKISTRNLS